jgi:hypothetical protein
MSTYKEKFNKKYKFPLEANHSLKEISEVTGYKLNGLKVIFRKGKGAFFTNYSSVRPIVKKNGGVNRWAYARVYSAVMGGKARKYDIDHLIKKK